MRAVPCQRQSNTLPSNGYGVGRAFSPSTWCLLLLLLLLLHAAVATVAWPSLEAPNNSCQREVGRAHGRERAGGCAWMAGQGLFEPFPAT